MATIILTPEVAENCYHLLWRQDQSIDWMYLGEPAADDKERLPRLTVIELGEIGKIIPCLAIFRVTFDASTEIHLGRHPSLAERIAATEIRARYGAKVYVCFLENDALVRFEF